jgi:BlaI family transcriptional regulator, penicillinase repressor
MPDPHYQDLSRRERQIMDIVYRLQEATAAEVMDQLPEAPGYSAVRAMLRILVDRGYLQHRKDGPRYVYSATVPREDAQSSALERVVSTFFDNSVSEAVAALINMSEEFSDEELDRLSDLISRSKKEGR